LKMRMGLPLYDLLRVFLLRITFMLTRLRREGAFGRAKAFGSGFLESCTREEMASSTLLSSLEFSVRVGSEGVWRRRLSTVEDEAEEEEAARRFVVVVVVVEVEVREPT